MTVSGITSFVNISHCVSVRGQVIGEDQIL